MVSNCCYLIFNSIKDDRNKIRGVTDRFPPNPPVLHINTRELALRNS